MILPKSSRRPGTNITKSRSHAGGKEIQSHCTLFLMHTAPITHSGRLSKCLSMGLTVKFYCSEMEYEQETDSDDDSGVESLQRTVDSSDVPDTAWSV